MSNPELDNLVQTEQKPETITLELSVNEVNVILAALQELPHRVADPILRNILSQAQPQAPQQG